MVRNSELPESTEEDLETIVINQKRIVSPTQTHRRMYLREAGMQVLYNGAHLDMDSCFGVSQRPFRSNIVFLDEDEEGGGTARTTLVYSCSEKLIIFNMLSQKQAFLPYEARGSISFLDTIRKKEGLIYVIGERYPESPPSLVFYIPDRKPVVLPHSHLKPNAYLKQVKLPREAHITRNVCVSLSSYPHVLSIWKIDKQKLLTEKELKVQQPVFDQDPENPLQIVVAGYKYLRLWEINLQEKRIDESQVHLVHLKVERDTDFIDVKYVPGSKTLLALSGDNKVYVFENNEQVKLVNDVFTPGSQGLISPVQQDQYIAVINKQLGQITPETAQAECLAVSRRGFFVGGSGGFLSVFFFEDGRPPLHISTTQLSPSATHTKGLSVSSDDQTIVCVCQKSIDSTQIESKSGRSGTEDEMPEMKLEFYLANLKKIESELQDGVWPLFPASQHFGAIRDISISVSRNQVVTVGDDGYLRVWHYVTEWKGVIEHKFPEHALSVGLHPHGYQVAVGFKDAFKVFSVLDEQLFPIIDQVVKMCFGLAYSPGGRYLAANNGGTVFILSPYTLSIVASYASHSAPVHSLVWNHVETLLTSCCFGGSVAVWDLQKCELRGPSPTRGGKLFSACYDEDFDMYLVLTSEGICRIHTENCSRTFILPTNNFHYTALLLVKELGLLFLGTNIGILRIALWPLLPNVDTESFDFQDVQIHAKDINRIEVSIPHEELATVGADGSVFLHSLRILQAGARIPLSKALLRDVNPHQSLVQYTTPDSKVFSLLALVKRDKLDILTARIRELEDGTSTLKSQHKYNLETVERENKDEVEKLRADYEDKLRFEGDYIARLKKDMESRDTEYKLSLASVKSQHEVEIEEMARKHDLQQTEHQDRYDTLRDEMEELKAMYATEVESLINLHKEVKANIERDCQSRVKEVKDMYGTLWETMKKQSEEYESGLQMTEKEYEDELAKEKERLSKALSEAQDEVLALKATNKTLATGKDESTKREDGLTKKTQDLEELLRSARLEIEELKGRMLKMQEQLVEREDVIKKKENTIKELRSFNIHLQNFRFVLDQKIKALKDDRGPMGEQMVNLQRHIRDMYSELLEEFENTKSSGKLAAELKAKNRSLSDLNSQLRREIVLAKRKVALIQSDLVQLVRITNKDSLLFGLKQLIDKHLSMDELVRGSDGELAKADSMSVEEANLMKVKQEVMYQHDLMKEQLMAIQRKTKTLETKSSSEVQRKMQENAALIKECNLLRNENSRLLRENSGLRDRSGAAKTQGSATGALTLPKVTHLKDTPYQQLKKAGSAADLRREDRSAILPKDKLPPPSAIRPELRIKTLISELEKNQNEIIEQNTQFRRLQEQVSTFLYQPDSLRPPDSESEAPSTPLRLREASPKGAQLSHSATQPVLAVETSQKPEATTVIEYRE